MSTYCTARERLVLAASCRSLNAEVLHRSAGTFGRRPVARRVSARVAGIRVENSAAARPATCGLTASGLGICRRMRALLV